MGSNKEAFDAEGPAIYRALLWLEQRQEGGRRYTLFADSSAAIERVRSDRIGPGQRFAIATIEVCDRILTRDNQVTIRWVPSHNRVGGNEMADTYAKAAASRSAPCHHKATPRELLGEATLSYMNHTATEARSRDSAKWIKDNVRAERRYRPPPTPPAPPRHQKGTGRAFLPVSVQQRQHRVVPPQGGDDRRRYVLVVRHRRAPDPLSPRCQVPRMEGTGTGPVEEG